jgi:ribosomal protein S18 acetylase RimI-like enzyme
MREYELLVLAEKDLEALLALYKSCEDFLALGPQPHASEKMVLADLALSREYNGTFYGIYTAGQLCGVLDLTASGWQDRADTAYINLLMFAREARGQGLGTQVLADTEQRLSRQGITRICAGVQVNNPGALRFWQAHGFQITSPPHLQPDGTTTVDLEKQTGDLHRSV